MLNTGLLLLTTPAQQIVLPRIVKLLQEAQKYVAKCLYVHVETPNEDKGDISQYCHVAELFYSSAHKCCNHLPLTVLIPPKCTSNHDIKFSPHRLVDIILNDESIPEHLIREIYQKRFTTSSRPNIPLERITSTEIPLISNQNHPPKEWKQYEKVVLGGTFDRLHNGHKVLLNHALMKCTQELTIGITVGPMIYSKVMWELIESTDLRRRKLREFLEDCNPVLDYKIEDIIDPFGPSIVDPDLSCIVVSRETFRGGQKVNEQRNKKGMSTLDIHVVEVVEDEGCELLLEEDKISSSTERMRVLGSRLKKPEQNIKIPARPYVVGLTGGIGAGKTSIADRLELCGAFIIDCDKLGHKVYTKGKPAYNNIVQHFGKGILGENGEIKRRALGEIVFSDKALLEKLNRIVWPEISNEVDRLIEECRTKGVGVVILDAGLLIEAGWTSKCHELWVAIIPPDEAVRRILLRDGITEVQARQRISSQLPNIDRVNLANVVLCTLWDEKVTDIQVQKAWTLLQDELEPIKPNL